MEPRWDREKRIKEKKIAGKKHYFFFLFNPSQFICFVYIMCFREQFNTTKSIKGYVERLFWKLIMRELVQALKLKVGF